MVFTLSSKTRQRLHLRSHFTFACQFKTSNWRNATLSICRTSIAPVLQAVYWNAVCWVLNSWVR